MLGLGAQACEALEFAGLFDRKDQNHVAILVKSSVQFLFVLRRRRPDALVLGQFDILVIVALDNEIDRVLEKIFDQRLVVTRFG